MKNYPKLALFTIFALLCSVAPALAHTAADPEWTPGARMTQAMHRLIHEADHHEEDSDNDGISNKTDSDDDNDGISDKEDKDDDGDGEADSASASAEEEDYGFDKAGASSLYGGFCIEDDPIKYGKNLEAGVRYLFVLAGDDGANDVDLDILDEKGNVVASEAKSDGDNLAAVEFVPPTTGRYTLRATLDEGGEHEFLALAVLRDEGGIDIAEEQFDAAYNDLIELGGKLEKEQPTVFLEEKGKWALFGGVMNAGQTLGVDSNLCEGQCFLAAAADSKIKGLELLLNDMNGKNLAKETDVAEHHLVIERKTSAKERFQLRAKNTASDGPSFVLMAVFQGTGN